ncbi:hypothetical protein SADUNF_Sadunf12G0002500 [Salix dunnii]|uniref:Uncharacterized protein n=1 Tax=Salix dunnii TaxID=1413687 RepID=A0A835JGX2_9ROSI|nr:hypothetical protein SADUNF_Sadunf12G0002500 [Salix dunnii]
MPESTDQVVLQKTHLVKGRFLRRALAIVRNKLIFEDIMLVWNTMFELTLYRLSSLLNAMIANFLYTGNDLLEAQMRKGSGDWRAGIRRVKFLNVGFYSSPVALDVSDEYKFFRAFGDSKFHDLELRAQHQLLISAASVIAAGLARTAQHHLQRRKNPPLKDLWNPAFSISNYHTLIKQNRSCNDKRYKCIIHKTAVEHAVPWVERKGPVGRVGPRAITARQLTLIRYLPETQVPTFHLILPLTLRLRTSFPAV